MPLNVVRGGGSALRSLYLNSVSRPVRVAICQPHVRRVCLATHRGTLKPIVQAVPAYDALSRQLLKTYATATEDKTDKKTIKDTKDTKAAPKKTPKKTTKKTTKSATKKTTRKSKETRGRKPKPELSEAQKEQKAKRNLREKIQKLKVTALSPPKVRGSSWWIAAITDLFPTALSIHKTAQPSFKWATEQAKNFSKEEKDRYRVKAKADREQDLINYDKWVKTHTPAQIRDANHARHRLSLLTGRHHNDIKDDRLVKGITSAFASYTRERTSSGDFKHLHITQSIATIGEEWRGLTDSEKEKYVKMQLADKERYVQECREVYGDEPSTD